MDRPDLFRRFPDLRPHHLPEEEIDGGNFSAEFFSTPMQSAAVFSAYCRRHVVPVVFEPVGDLRLHDEQRAGRFQQPADVRERLYRLREIVDAVACGDQVEAAAAIDLVGPLREKTHAPCVAR